MLKYLAVLGLWFGVTLVQANSTAKGEFCAEYQEQFSKQQVAYQTYCDEEPPADYEKLFPEFAWCVKQTDPTLDCGDKTEQQWCKSQGEDKAKQQLAERDSKLSSCRSAYEQWFGKSSSKVEELVPSGYAMVNKESSSGRLAPIEHDFNKDGKADWVFVMGKPLENETQPQDRLRLMVALSQADGTLKTLAVAPYWMSNYPDDEAGSIQSSIKLHESDGLLVSTASVEEQGWSRRDEYLFRYRDGEFVLMWESSGFNEPEVDDSGTESGSATTIVDYEKAVIMTSATERCDSYGSEPCTDMDTEELPAKRQKKTIRDFLEL